MKQCDAMRAQITFYLDDELQGNERTVFESHVGACDACREIFDAERRFLDALRGSGRLHVAAPQLRTRIETLLSGAPPSHTAPYALRRRVHRSLSQLGYSTSRTLSYRHVTVVTAIVVMTVAAGVWGLTEYYKTRARPLSDFALVAVDAHERRLRGLFPLEIASEAPEQIAAWFAGRIPFSLELPNYQGASGQEKLYDLEGAALVGYKGGHAAYVAYKMRTRPISLLVTSEALAQASGGEEIASNGIKFHYDSIGGLKVITWSDRGLTYALVSDLEERGQQSCIVCHQGTRDQDFIENLKPR